MKKEYFKISLSLLAGFIFILGCSNEIEINVKLPKPFSIRINKEFNEKEADSLKTFLKSKITDSLYIINDDDFYTVNIGYYNSSLIAGQKAFNLYTDSVITGYAIYYGDSAKVYDEYRYIPYLGEDMNRPALFKYDLLRKRSLVIWSKWGRKIINFSYPSNFTPAYFLTALTFGREAGFPYITDVRAYKYNIADNTVKRMEKLGKGLQVFASYDSSKNYEVYFNILDSTNTANIIQVKKTYNNSGQNIDASERVYNILNEGYPVPYIQLPQLISPGKNYYLKAEGKDSTLYYYLNNYEMNKRDFVFSSNMELVKTGWSKNEDFLMLSLKDISSPDSSKLIVIRTSDAAVRNEFENKGALNFIVHGDLLIFDCWNRDDSKIIIYNYKKETAFDTLSVPGGCGLSYIKSEYIGY